MLQEIEAPYKWDGGDWTATYMAEGSRYIISLNHLGWSLRDITMPPGAVLAQEVDAPAPADPFYPNKEVRAALRNLHGRGTTNTPEEYFEQRVTLRAWIRSWPDEA